MLSLLPASTRARVKALPVYALNHQLEFKIQGGRDTAENVVGLWREAVACNRIDFGISSNDDIKVSAEVSPWRREACRAFFSACTTIRAKGIREDQMVSCPRSLRLYTAAYGLLGEVADDGTWKWCSEGCESLGVGSLAGGEDDVS